MDSCPPQLNQKQIQLEHHTPLGRIFALSKLRIPEITEVSIPGIDATVIVDVLDPQLNNNYSNTVSILILCFIQKSEEILTNFNPFMCSNLTLTYVQIKLLF